jgi:hypothetical protein
MLTTALCSVCGVHSSGAAAEGDPEEAGGAETGRDQEGPPGPHLLQVSACKIHTVYILHKRNLWVKRKEKEKRETKNHR